VLPESVVHDPERIARFRREAQILALLNHPNIAHIHGLEESDGIRALVMELVEGPTLEELIARQALGSGLSAVGKQEREAREHQSAVGWHRQGSRLRPRESRGAVVQHWFEELKRLVPAS
jgi:hypothetical protein